MVPPFAADVRPVSPWGPSAAGAAHAGRRLWAITSYFNPAGYRTKLRNYRAFRQALRVPLVAVETARPGRFELRDGDADVLVRIAGGDVLWQKERLLNVALAFLPGACEAVAWIDADVRFAHASWVDAALDALGRHALVHLFSERRDLPPPPGIRSAEPRARTRRSLVAAWRRGGADLAALRVPGAAGSGTTTIGLAWAAPRALLEAHGFYDACVLGGGDRAMLSAATGAIEAAVTALRMNERQRRHYLAWAAAFHGSVGGRVAAIPGVVHHLWHGDLRRRGYVERFDRFEAFGFDPDRDISAAGSGPWRWSSGKAAMHAYVREYFRGRLEDGVAPSRGRGMMRRGEHEDAACQQGSASG